MTTAAIPTVDELVAQYKEAGWDCLPDLIDQMFEDCLVPGVAIKEASAGVYTTAPCGYYYSPATDCHGILVPKQATAQDFALCKAAAVRVGQVESKPLTIEDVSTGNWVKVASSPWVNKTLQYLNFLPGKYPGGVPNFPSPIASMATTGLLGAGLGYGAGWLGEKFLPDKWKEGRLRKTLAALGGMVGMVPGAMWGGGNLLAGNDFNKASLKNAPRHPTTGYEIPASAHSFDPKQQKINDQQAFERAGELKFGSAFAEANDSVKVELGKQYAAAAEKTAHAMFGGLDDLTFTETFLIKNGGLFGPNRYAPQQPAGPLDINVDRMGNVLWDIGAGPSTAAMTMGAIHAAQQMPGGRPESGWVTPTQMAGLAAHMGVGYVSGALVGSALGLLTGMPEGTQQTLKDTGMYLGIVKSVVPKLFGQ